jgi:hypothetical protein
MTETNSELEDSGQIRIGRAPVNRRLRVLPPQAGQVELADDPQFKFQPWPRTLLSAGEISDLIESVPIQAFGSPDSKGAKSRRRTSVRDLLVWLELIPGGSWQERWDASKIESDVNWCAHIIQDRNRRPGLHYTNNTVPHAVAWLIAIDVIRPSYEWLHRQHERLLTLPGAVLGVRDAEGGQAIVDAIARHSASELLFTRYRTHALFQLARILARTGKQHVRDITPEDLFAARESARGQRKRLPSGAAYNAMSWAGFLPSDAPRTFSNSRRTGQLSPEQLVDRTGIASRQIRDLFVDYFRTRSASLDYVSLSGLVGTLVTNFWVEIEQLSPGIETLSLTPELVETWKERIRTVRHGPSRGKPRRNPGAIMVAVRAFYFDINDWAQSDPARYAQFAGPNPIGPDDTLSYAKALRRQRAASHRRTRERLPHLPTLMAAVTDGLRWHREALQIAQGRQIGETFDVGGVPCQIPVPESIAFGSRTPGIKRIGGLVMRRLDTGKTFDAVQREAVFFWRWATFSVLKETGIRIEEMEELTHTSITQYRLPSTGEVLPLLQIAPSKTDQERVLLVSPELADVLAAIIARVRDASGTGRIPLIRRWDYHEKILTEPMPFLFQRPIDGEHRPINRAWTLTNLRAIVKEIGLVGEDGEPIYFQNHDLRRLFATEAVMAGLPVHILANVMGHESLDTTQRYAAIYDEDVYRRHRAFMERRRSIRPSAEYREPTDVEWGEFLGHFERRQLELGVCGRAFGTPCIHEHACVRCSMLQPDPKQAGRLQEIIANLEARIREAHSQGWLGEVEGLEISLAGAQQKLASMSQQTGPVSLGLPTFRPGDT